MGNVYKRVKPNIANHCRFSSASSLLSVNSTYTQPETVNTHFLFYALLYVLISIWIIITRVLLFCVLLLLFVMVLVCCYVIIMYPEITIVLFSKLKWKPLWLHTRVMTFTKTHPFTFSFTFHRTPAVAVWFVPTEPLFKRSMISVTVCFLYCWCRNSQ